MELTRKPYLITQAIKSYLMASILTTAIGQLNGVIDSVLMGNLIGPEALSAITLCLPVIAVVSVVYVLLATGASILAGKAIGERNYGRSADIFTVSMVSLTVAAAAVAVGGWAWRSELSALLCSDSRLFPYVLEYFGWTMALSPFTIFSQAFSQFTDVDGRPRTVTLAMTITLAVNAMLDVLLVWGCGMGIAGSAVATAVSCLCSIVFLVYQMATRSHSYRLHWPVKQAGRVLADNVKNGTTMMLMTVMGAVMIIFLNSVVLDKLGADGMFSMSIGTSLLSVGLFLSQGLSQAFIAIGSMLYGQRDYQGMRLLFNRCALLVLSLAVLLTLVGQLCPELLVRLYGADTPRLIAMAARDIRIATLMFIPCLMLALMPSVYQVMGHLRLVAVLTLLFYVLLLPTIWLLAQSSHPNNLWYAFPIAGWVGVLVFAPLLWLFHRRMPGTSLLTLIPIRNPYRQDTYLSVPATQTAVEEASWQVRRFTDGLDGDGDARQRTDGDDAGTAGTPTDAVVACIETLLNHIVAYAGLKPTSLIDLRVTLADDGLLVTLKDNGRAGDAQGLTHVRQLCPLMDYKYMYGQNMTFLKFPQFSPTSSCRSQGNLVPLQTENKQTDGV